MKLLPNFAANKYDPHQFALHITLHLKSQVTRRRLLGTQLLLLQSTCILTVQNNRAAGLKPQ